MSYLEFQCQQRFHGGFELDLHFHTTHLVTALFGPSGSGKTSVLEMIAGGLRPKSGFFQLNERVLLDSQKKHFVPPRHRHIGMVFQDHLLFPHMSVERNLRFGQQRRRRRERNISFDRVIDVLNLQPLLQRYPTNLSGGERQRVALGRALLSSPDLLLLDEPLSALDEGLKGRIMSYIDRAVQEWSIPTLLVSHAQMEIRRLAQWVIVMDKGRVITEGTPEQALSSPQPLAWENTEGPINLLQIEEITSSDGVYRGRIGQQFLQLPYLPEDHQGALYVYFSPASVLLAPQDIHDISARNHLTGTVMKVLHLSKASFIAIDVGQTLWAEVTHEAVKDLQIHTGSSITCLIKTHNLHLVD